MVVYLCYKRVLGGCECLRKVRVRLEGVSVTGNQHCD